MSFTYILSQVFIVICYSLMALSYLTKSHKMVLVYSSCSLVAEGTAYILLSAWSGMAMVIIASTRNILFALQSKFLAKHPKYKNYNWVALFIVYGMCIAGCFITYQGFFSLFSILACMVFTYSLWQEDRFWYHVLGVISGAFLIIYNIYIGSVFGIAMEGMLVLWIVFQLFTKYSYRGFVLKNKKKRYSEELPPPTKRNGVPAVACGNLPTKE